MTQPRRAIQRDRVPPSLAAASLVIAAVACLMAALASVPFVVPSDVINVNTASSETIANDLEIDIALADALIAERDRLGAFVSVRQALDVPVVPRARYKAALSALTKLDVQAASAADLAAALEVPRASAERLIHDRSSRPNQRWPGPSAILGVSVFEASSGDALRTQLIVRTPGQAFSLLLLWAATGCACLWALWIMQRRIIPGADTWFAAMAIVPAGLALAVAVAHGDPLRDSMIVAHSTIALALGALGFTGGLLVFARSHSAGRRLNAPSSMDPIAWLTSAGWVAVCLLTSGGARAGIAGIRWCGPWLAIWVASGLIRRYAGLGPERLRAATFGSARASKQAGVQATLAWSALPVAGMLAAGLCTRDAGAAVATALSLTLLLYSVSLRAACFTGVVLCAIGLVPSLALDSGASVAVQEWISPWIARDGQVPGSAAMYWAIASGGPFGTGLGLAPDAAQTGVSTLAAIGEQLGTPGIGLVLLCVVVLAWRSSRVALLAGDDGQRLLGIGAFSALTAFALLSVGGEMGLIPDFHVRLPFAADSRILQTLWFGTVGALAGLSGILGPVGVGVDRTAMRRRLQELATCGAALILAGGTLRSAYIATYAADRLASHTVRNEDPGRQAFIGNPRLETVAAGLERGSVLDASGRVLATSRLREISRYHQDDAALARRYYRAGRYYPHGSACAAIVGLWTRHGGALSGVERSYDTHLRGFERTSDLLPLYRAKDLPQSLRPRRLRGGDVVLTINAVLQEDGYRILERAARGEDNARPTRAALVVLNASTGQPIVSVSVPSVDPNRMVLRSVGAIRVHAQVLSAPDQAHAIVPAPPGPFKIASALASGETGVPFETECAHSEVGLHWDDGGSQRSMDLLQDDPRDAPHGRIGMGRAVRSSCNIWFGKLAVSIGAQLAYDRLAAILGPAAMPSRDAFGRKLPAMFCGLDGMMVSPVQMAGLAASLTTERAPLMPHSLYELRYADGRRPAPAPLPVEASEVKPLPREPVAVIRKALVDAVADGPAADVFAGLRLTVAGKAASVNIGQSADRMDAWFVGFAPVRTPAFAFACWIENGRSGTRAAAGVVRNMLREMAGP